MPQKIVFVQALYDYTRKHTDELSFKRGDVLAVSQQLDGGWWEGSLNGVVGWFPSNYVAFVADSTSGDTRAELDPQLLIHLHNFQEEIVQHILEGEVRQVNELAQLVSSLILNLEPLGQLPFLNKITHMKELLTKAISMHQSLETALSQMKQSTEPRRVGRLFLEFAPTVNAIGCDYSKIHLYVITGMDRNAEMIERHLSSCGIKYQPVKFKQQLSLVFDRLGRYPLLLKEMERYLEPSHVDREDIQRAMQVYGEITERCAILRKFKEYDIDILLSTIRGWKGVAIQELGDPILTLRVLLTGVEHDSNEMVGSSLLPSPSAVGQLSVLVIFPACVLLLARTKQVDVYEFTTKIPLHSLTVIGCFETETDLDLLISPSSTLHSSVSPCRISLSCTDQNARDLLVSTLNDLIQYQSQLDLTQTGPTPSTDTSGTLGVPEIGGGGGLSTSVTTPTAPSGPDNTPDRDVTKEESDPISPTEVNRHSSSLGEHPHHRPHAVYVEGSLGPENDPGISRPTDKVLSTVDKPTDSQQSGDKDCNRDAIEPAAVAKRGTSSTIDDPAPSPSDKESVLNHCSSKFETMPKAGPPLSPSLSAGIRLLPHKIQTHAHVQWLNQPRSGEPKQNDPPLPPRVLRCLQLDGPLDIHHNSYSHSAAAYSSSSPGVPLVVVGPITHQPGAHGSRAQNVVVTSSSHARPHSPKGEGGKDVRRKKSDRQKSAINVDEVMRSVGQLQDTERRNADAARILQVVEAYCASAWNQLSCRSLEPGKTQSVGPCSSALLPTEGKTLPQLISPTLFPAEIRNGAKRRPESAAELEIRPSGRSTNQAASKAVTKRSGPKTKSEVMHSPLDVAPCPGNQVGAHPTPSSGSASVLQSFSPPPVILPTRGGRRLRN